MKKYFIILFAVLITASCGKSAKIDAAIEGVGDAEVVLQKLNYNKLVLIDTIKSDADGHFSYKVKLQNESPAFYYLFYNNNKIAGMILLPGDKVTIKADTLGLYEIEGSVESANLKKVDDQLAADINKMEKLSVEALSIGSEDQEGLKNINRQMSRVYIDHKRSVLRQIMENPHSITSATVLFQKFNDELPVFGEVNDVILFKNVYDSLQPVYPSSEYLVALKDEIARRENIFNLQTKIGDAQSINFPEIKMPDINGQEQSLSAYNGKVIILSFWSASQNLHKMFNNDLALIYDKYHSHGLEIYQVSLDVDKPAWASTVKSQKTPWCAVNDGLGSSSPAVAAYNLEKIPALFVIGKSGNIVAKDVFSVDELEKIIKKEL